MSRKKPEKQRSVEDSAHGEASTSAVFKLVDSLTEYSKDSWTSREEALWKRYLEICQEWELSDLRSRGLDAEKAQKLVEWVWVRRDPKSSDLVVEYVPPTNSSLFVPAIRVFRNGNFVIYHRVLNYLGSHPMLAIPGGDASADDDDRPWILQALDAIERDSGLGYIGLGYVSSAPPEDTGEERRLADCCDAAHQLHVLLDTKYLKSNLDEDLEWLRVAKDRDRFWRLLDTAFLIGEFMEHRRLLDKLGAEEAMRRNITMPPGKGGKIEPAVVRMIREYALENDLVPTAGKLLKWLGGEQPHDPGKALEVDHPLWTPDMKPITWPRFQDLVKKAKQKMKKLGRQ